MQLRCDFRLVHIGALKEIHVHHESCISTSKGLLVGYVASCSHQYFTSQYHTHNTHQYTTLVFATLELPHQIAQKILKICQQNLAIQRHKAALQKLAKTAPLPPDRGGPELLREALGVASPPPLHTKSRVADTKLGATRKYMLAASAISNLRHANIPISQHFDSLPFHQRLFREFF